MPLGGLGIIAGGLAGGLGQAMQMQQQTRQMQMYANLLKGRPIMEGLDGTTPGTPGANFGSTPASMGFGAAGAPAAVPGAGMSPGYNFGATPASMGFGATFGQQPPPGMNFPMTRGLYGGM